jgi:hypothetical protein
MCIHKETDALDCVQLVRLKDQYKAVLKPCQIYGNQEKLPVKDHDILLQSFGEELSTSPAQSQ